MKRIEVRDQVSLPVRRCFQLCVRGIRYRLFRSAITVAIVTLAVAFLMMMLSTSYVDREVAKDVRERTADRRLLGEWLDKLTVPLTPKSLLLWLEGLKDDSDAAKELRGWGDVSDEQLRELSRLAGVQLKWEAYLAGIDAGERNELVGAREGDEVFEYLRDPKLRDRFVKRAKEMRAGTLPGSKEDLAAYVADFSRTKPLRVAIIAGHKKAVDALAEDLKGPSGETTSVLEFFRREREATVALLTRHGFILAEGDFSRLRAEALVLAEADKILALLKDKRLRGVIARRAKVKPKDIKPKHAIKIASSKRGARWLNKEVDTAREKAFAKIAESKEHLALMTAVLKLADKRVVELAKGKSEQLGGLADIEKVRQAVGDRLSKKDFEIEAEHIFQVADDDEGAAWLKTNVTKLRDELPREIQALQEGIVEPLGLPIERMAEVADAWLDQDRLRKVETSLVDLTVGGRWGFSDRTGWLIIISFMVCAVGVTNAMLMSVTERFREIATMKCLGALDSFIMISFVLESSLQGLAGGLMGVVIGFVLGTLRSCWGFGLLAVVNLPGLILLASAGVCMVAGIMLAALAALYPAWVAARLAPMEAMRIE